MPGVSATVSPDPLRSVPRDGRPGACPGLPRPGRPPIVVRVISTHDLTKRFGDRVAIENLTLRVEPGETVGLLGPNGAGKTTTIRLLAALIAPTAGSAEVAGLTVGEDDDGIRRRVGLLTEAPGLYDTLDVRDNLVFFARLHGLSARDPRIDRTLEFLDLAERRGEPAAALSKGMRQKLALARALVHEPDVLLLDEPTAGLDPRTARRVRETIDDLRAAGRTILLSTHDLAEAEALCDRIAVIDGRLVAGGPPAALRARGVARTTRIRLAGDAAGHVYRLENLPAVRSARATGATLLLEIDDPERGTPNVVRALVEARADVIEVAVVSPALEDVYLALLEPGPEESSR